MRAINTPDSTWSETWLRHVWRVVCQHWSDAGVGIKGNTRQVTAKKKKKKKEYHPQCYTRDNGVIYLKESGAEELQWPHTSTGR